MAAVAIADRGGAFAAFIIRSGANIENHDDPTMMATIAARRRCAIRRAAPFRSAQTGSARRPRSGSSRRKRTANHQQRAAAQTIDPVGKPKTRGAAQPGRHSRMRNERRTAGVKASPLERRRLIEAGGDQQRAADAPSPIAKLNSETAPARTSSHCVRAAAAKSRPIPPHTRRQRSPSAPSRPLLPPAPRQPP